MGTNVQHGVNIIADSEESYGQAAYLHDSRCAGGNFISTANQSFLRHAILKPPWFLPEQEYACKPQGRSGREFLASTRAADARTSNRRSPNGDNRTQTARCSRHPWHRESTRDAGGYRASQAA